MTFWQARTKVDAADRLFSEFIRKMRDGNKCRRCGISGEITQLDNSHFFGRAKESTRFDPENCDALCRTCHAYFEDRKGIDRFEHNGGIIEKPQAYREWKIKQLGPVRFAALEVRAATQVKKDRKLSLLVVKAMIKDWRERLENHILGRRM